MLQIIEQLNGILWGPWTPFVLLLAGVLFTFWTKFTQYTAMTHGVQVVRGVYDDPDDPGAINHFQALSAALSATVGLGNIGGVAMAISVGGPGALFWMWITGIFGMALKTIEITLAMMYRNVDDPENPHGGAMWVVEKTLGSRGGAWKLIARGIGTFFCVTLVISTFTGGNLYQSWSVAGLTNLYFGVPNLVTGTILAIVVGLAILGGIKRIGAVAGRLVPFMVVLYLIAAFTVIFGDLAEVPAMLSLVVSSAFNPTEAGGAFVGGMAGLAFITGMKRALFSNEAGQGSAPIAHAAAKTDEAAREGIVGGIGPFIDTLTICTLTALVILLSGSWNRPAIQDAEGNTVELAASIDFLEKERTESGVVFGVNSDATPASLPESRWNDGAGWRKGSSFFLVGRILGEATSRDSGGKLVHVVGTVTEKAQAEGSDAPAEMEIVWSDVKVSSNKTWLGEADYWTGEVTGIELVDKGVYHKYDGAELTGHSFDRAFGGVGVGKYLVTLAAWLFAISTMISWSYYGEQGIIYVFGLRGVLPYKMVFLVAVIAAATGIGGAQEMFLFMDLGTGAMLWANLPIIMGLGYLAVRELKNYVRDLKAGKFKRHDAPSITDLASGSDVEKKD
ncbi:MAG: alanine/glycine:cation symporter family protein [Planctomycetota bacterium]